MPKFCALKAHGIRASIKTRQKAPLRSSNVDEHLGCHKDLRGVRKMTVRENVLSLRDMISCKAYHDCRLGTRTCTSPAYRRLARAASASNLKKYGQLLTDLLRDSLPVECRKHVNTVLRRHMAIVISPNSVVSKDCGLGIVNTSFAHIIFFDDKSEYLTRLQQYVIYKKAWNRLNMRYERIRRIIRVDVNPIGPIIPSSEMDDDVVEKMSQLRTLSPLDKEKSTAHLVFLTRSRARPIVFMKWNKRGGRNPRTSFLRSSHGEITEGDDEFDNFFVFFLSFSIIGFSISFCACSQLNGTHGEVTNEDDMSQQDPRSESPDFVGELTWAPYDGPSVAYLDQVPTPTDNHLPDVGQHSNETVEPITIVPDADMPQHHANGAPVLGIVVDDQNLEHVSLPPPPAPGILGPQFPHVTWNDVGRDDPVGTTVAVDRTGQSIAGATGNAMETQTDTSTIVNHLHSHRSGFWVTYDEDPTHLLPTRVLDGTTTMWAKHETDTLFPTVSDVWLSLSTLYYQKLRSLAVILKWTGRLCLVAVPAGLVVKYSDNHSGCTLSKTSVLGLISAGMFCYITNVILSFHAVRAEARTVIDARYPLIRRTYHEFQAFNQGIFVWRWRLHSLRLQNISPDADVRTFSHRRMDLEASECIGTITVERIRVDPYYYFTYPTYVSITNEEIDTRNAFDSLMVSNSIEADVALSTTKSSLCRGVNRSADSMDFPISKQWFFLCCTCTAHGVASRNITLNPLGKTLIK